MLTWFKVSQPVSLTLGHGSLAFELMIHQIAGPFFPYEWLPSQAFCNHENSVFGARWGGLLFLSNLFLFLRDFIYSPALPKYGFISGKSFHLAVNRNFCTPSSSDPLSSINPLSTNDPLSANDPLSTNDPLSSSDPLALVIFLFVHYL